MPIPFLLLAVLTQSARPSQADIDKAIDSGAEYLKKQQKPDGSWEMGPQDVHLRILAVSAEGGAAPCDREDFAAALARVIHAGEPRDVDLVIRTGGEHRLSDFLLWESAYAELYFTDRMWPDFDADDLAEALAWFRGRKRRFGLLPEEARR